MALSACRSVSSRSDPRPRRRFLRLLAAVPAADSPRRSDARRACRAERLPRIYLLSGHLTSGFPARLSMSSVARRHLILLGAAFFVLLALGRLAAARSEHLVESSGLIHGASYADVIRPHAGGAAPAMAVALVGAGAGAVAGVPTPELADSCRRRPLPRRLDRRRDLQHRPAAVRRHARTSRCARRRSSSTTSRPRDAPSGSRASRSGRYPAMRC